VNKLIFNHMKHRIIKVLIFRSTTRYFLVELISFFLLILLSYSYQYLFIIDRETVVLADFRAFLPLQC
jgi:hypothetical protein